MKRPLKIGLAAAALSAAGVVALVALPALWPTGGGSDTGAASAAAVVERPAEPRFPHGRIRVEVLNAGGRAGLAREVTGRLRAAGFDVVYFGNARGFAPDSSLVLDRAGRPEGAVLVARELGIARVQSRPDPALLLEATVVLGRDWAPARSEPEPRTAPERARAWLLGLFGR